MALQCCCDIRVQSYYSVAVPNIDLDISPMKDNGAFLCFLVLPENELRVLETNDKNFETS